MKPFNRRKKKTISLDIAPLLDVMFMLLLFFLLTSTFMKPSMSLNLPEASNSEKLQKQDIIITLDKNGNKTVNSHPVSTAGMIAFLRKAEANSKEVRVIFYGHEDVPYKAVVDIIDSVKKAGIKNINIAHDKR